MNSSHKILSLKYFYEYPINHGEAVLPNVVGLICSASVRFFIQKLLEPDFILGRIRFIDILYLSSNKLLRSFNSGKYVVPTLVRSDLMKGRGEKKKAHTACVLAPKKAL